MRKVFTTGQVAKICKVAPRTVSKWFDSGRLRGYRIPGSQDRRIPREQLVRFMREYGIPLGELEDEVTQKVLIADPRRDVVSRLTAALSLDRDVRMESACSGFEAGIKAEQFHPDCILINLDLDGMDGRVIAENLRQNANFKNLLLIALVNQGQPFDAAELKARGFDEYFCEPMDVAQVAERIRQTLSVNKG